jgi:uncharacterized membrane protein
MTGTLLDLVLAAAGFVGTHLLLSAAPLRARLVARLGQWGFRGLYTVIAWVFLIWMIWAWRDAPFEPLWGTGIGHRHWTMTLMLPASILLVAGYTTHNPTALGLDRLPAGGDPAPGIIKVTRHPILWAYILWGSAHMIGNGDTAALVFFGSFVVLSILGTIALDRRKRRELGEARWQALAAASSNLPFLAVAQGRARLRLADFGRWRLALGLLIYLGFYFAHPLVFGVSPLGG